MSNYRNKDITAFVIKTGSTGKIRLFFNILNHPWETMMALNEFKNEVAELEAKLVETKNKAAEALFENAKLKEELYALKRGQK